MKIEGGFFVHCKFNLEITMTGICYNNFYYVTNIIFCDTKSPAKKPLLYMISSHSWENIFDFKKYCIESFSVTSCWGDTRRIRKAAFTDIEGDK